MPREDARARAIVARLSEGNASSDEVFEAFEELDQLPPEVVRGAFEPWVGPAPDLERLDDTVRRAHRLPLRTPRLGTLASDRDADVLELGTIGEEQLRIAGKTWDGQDLEPWDCLDGEREDSFAGTLERRVLGEGKTPLYDVMLFGEGAGVFFRAGTTKVLGVIADHRVETSDRPARIAIEQALLASPPAPPPVASPVSKPEPEPSEPEPATLVAKPKSVQLALPMDAIAPPVSEPEPATIALPIPPSADSEPEPEPEPEPEAEAEAESEPAPAPKKAKKKAAAAKKKTAAAAPAPKKKAASGTKKAAAAPKKKAAAKKKKSSSAE